MVPEAFHDYFVASTGTGAALVGLLFVVVSITPERTVMTGGSNKCLYRLAQSKRG